MPGDYSRFTDDPKKRFSRVLYEQGRVLQDADLDEMVEILTRRDRLHMLDIMGRAAIPKVTTPNGFAISASGAGNLKIGAGRAYVDGIVAEAFDTDTLTYLKQPFYPDPPKLNTVSGGAGLAYLDVWEREITSLEDPSLPDPALGGVDTSTRTQTVWQVKVKDGADCGSDLDAIFPPSAGRLSVKVDLPPDPPDPCILPESGGLRDVENRFYRVEIHGTGAPARFKFARDPVATRISKIPAAVGGKTTIEVEHIGRDSVLRFSAGDWVEATNDYAVLRGEPGTMAQIELVDEGLLQIRLDRPVPQSWMNADYPPRLIRWDQRASASMTLDADGLIGVTGGWQSLEAGIQVRLTLDPPTGSFHHGDTWFFPTRVAGHTAGPLTNAPPRYFIHHYCALATLSGLGSTTAAPVIGSDCRNLWPPDTATGEDCECTVCVSPDDHNKGTTTIQQAISQAKAKGGGKVCLKPGLYFVRESIQIQDAVSLSLTGHGLAVILFLGTGPVIVIERCADVTVEELVIARAASEGNLDGVGIEIRNCLLDTTVQDCIIALYEAATATAIAPAPVGATHGVGVAFTGVVQGPHILRNVIAAGTGIGNPFDPAKHVTYVLSFGIDIRENLLLCGKTALAIAGVGLAMDVRQNWMLSGAAGISLFGLPYPGGAITIDANNIFTFGGGITFTTGITTISNNSITGLVPPDPATKEPLGTRLIASGITLGGAELPVAPEHVKIVGNRIAFFRGNGISLAGRVGSAMIKQNTIAVIGGGGVVGMRAALLGRLSVANNDIGIVGIAPFGSELPAAAIFFVGGANYEIADNNLFAVAPAQSFPSHGIYLAAPQRARVFGNAVSGVRPSLSNLASAGIEIAGGYGVAEIANNDVLWRRTDDPSSVPGMWYGVRVGIATVSKLVFVLPLSQVSPSVPGGARLNTLASAILAAGSFVVVAGWHVFELHSAEQALLVRGNLMQAIGSTTLPLVEIVTSGTTTFGENDCRAVHKEANDLRPSKGAVLTSETAIVDANHVLGAAELAMSISTAGQQWTVLGNIVEKGIAVNGAPLTGVWLDINRQL